MKPGLMFQFLMLLLCIGFVLAGITRGRQGLMPRIRKIPGLDAIEEAVGRATEIGKPVFMTPGAGGLGDTSAVQTLAALSILDHSVRLCGRYTAPFWMTMLKAEVYPLADQMVRDALAAENAMELYNDHTVEYLSEQQFAFAMGSLGRMQREGLGAAIIMGFFQAESLLLCEGAAQQGAVVIGGCSREVQIPYFAVACDYTLIGEELMVGGAYLSKNAIQMGTVWGQDCMKLVGLLLLVAGSILGLLKVDFLSKLFLR